MQTTSGTQCTVSGFKSSVASRAPSGSLACAGYRASHFVNQAVSPSEPAGWPAFASGVPSGATSLKAILVSDLFAGVGGGTTVFDELDQRSNSVLSLFIAAYFNAALSVQNASAPNYSPLPYSPADVVSQFNNGSPASEVVDFYTLVLVVA